MKAAVPYGHHWLWTALLVVAMVMGIGMAGTGQANGNICTVKQGKIYIELDRHGDSAGLENFIATYDLYDLPLREFLRGQWKDSLKKLGWIIMKDDAQSFGFAKVIESFSGFENPENKILFSEPHGAGLRKLPVAGIGNRYGVNKAKGRQPWAVTDSIVTFFLKGYQQLSQVLLAGSFTNWQYGALRMTKTDSGWIKNVKLAAGKHWYKFIGDGNWMTDPYNAVQENDGEGNMNSIYFKPNHTFFLAGFENARKVFVAGSFNLWDRSELAMLRTKDGWQLPVYLAHGTHTYRFVVDGRWMADPGSNDRFPNEFGEFNSVVRMGKPYVFKLAGFTNAKEVVLSGNFNGWRQNELYMKKVDSGWVLPYSLGPGNYEYNFLVDGQWTGVPGHAAKNGNRVGQGNLFFTLQPNYTFRLKGFGNARQIFLAGDFNDWAPGSFLLKKDKDEWVLDLYLTPGKHLYKLVVDGKWITDPTNKLWEQNEFNTGNSVLWIEEPGTRARPVI